VDSARANLAATFVNAFVNAGFGQDKLLTASEGEGEGEAASSGAGSNVSWIFKNKDHGKMSAAASLGSILLWDVEDGLPRVDNYLYSMEQQVVAGGLLAVGLINVNVKTTAIQRTVCCTRALTRRTPPCVLVQSWVSAWRTPGARRRRSRSCWFPL
jgi:hypothetical protein